MKTLIEMKKYWEQQENFHVRLSKTEISKLIQKKSSLTIEVIFKKSKC